MIEVTSVKTKEHGSCVVQQRVSSTAQVPDSTLDAAARSASSASHPAQQHRLAKVCAEFQVFDGDGVLQIRQTSDGRVFIPDKNAPIGQYVGELKKIFLVFI